ncbi:MAG: flagellar biosynthesis protein FlhB [Phycisphaerae bacterium]|nr:flagellar biosynthesis protein FlhB [Phycisphaerae bacterium]
MAEEEIGEKTEQPTQQRRQESRKQGQVAKSSDLTAALCLLGGVLTLNLLGPRILRELIGLTGNMLGPAGASLRPDSMIASARVGFGTAANVLLPLVLAVAATAMAANIVQVGFIASWHPVAPDFNKINPLAGFGRLFSRRNLVKLLVNVGKVVLVGWVAWAIIAGRLDQIVGLMHHDFWTGLAGAAELTFVLAIRLSLVLLVLALLDYGYTRFQHEQDLKMTRQEIREELRRMEGDPLLRARRLRVARQLAMQRMATEVPRADVIVTNPTHVAVALKYESGSMSAPKVIAKGADLMAEQIRRLAIEHHIPIVRRAPLARALYAACEVGQEIPGKFYKAVAEVLAYVYELAGKGVRRPQTQQTQAGMRNAGAVSMN